MKKIFLVCIVIFCVGFACSGCKSSLDVTLTHEARQSGESAEHRKMLEEILALARKSEREYFQTSNPQKLVSAQNYYLHCALERSLYVTDVQRVFDLLYDIHRTEDLPRLLDVAYFLNEKQAYGHESLVVVETLYGEVVDSYNAVSAKCEYYIRIPDLGEVRSIPVNADTVRVDAFTEISHLRTLSRVSKVLGLTQDEKIFKKKLADMCMLANLPPGVFARPEEAYEYYDEIGDVGGKKRAARAAAQKYLFMYFTQSTQAYFVESMFKELDSKEVLMSKAKDYLQKAGLSVAESQRKIAEIEKMFPAVDDEELIEGVKPFVYPK